MTVCVLLAPPWPGTVITPFASASAASLLRPLSPSMLTLSLAPVEEKTKKGVCQPVDVLLLCSR
jgi:hypothetical protein